MSINYKNSDITQLKDFNNNGFDILLTPDGDIPISIDGDIGKIRQQSNKDIISNINKALFFNNEEFGSSSIICANLSKYIGKGYSKDIINNIKMDINLAIKFLYPECTIEFGEYTLVNNSLVLPLKVNFQNYIYLFNIGILTNSVYVNYINYYN